MQHSHLTKSLSCEHVALKVTVISLICSPCVSLHLKQQDMKSKIQQRITKQIWADLSEAWGGVYYIYCKQSALVKTWCHMAHALSCLFTTKPSLFLWQRWHQSAAVLSWANCGVICPRTSKPLFLWDFNKLLQTCWTKVLGLEVWSRSIGMHLRTLHSGPPVDRDLALITACGMSHDSCRAAWHISPSFTAPHPVKDRWLHAHTPCNMPY